MFSILQNVTIVAYILAARLNYLILGTTFHQEYNIIIFLTEIIAAVDVIIITMTLIITSTVTLISMLIRARVTILLLFDIIT